MMEWCEKHNLPAEYSKVTKKWECKKCRENKESKISRKTGEKRWMKY